MVKFPDGEQHVVRLYFADCPETGATAPGDARRIREQTRYFGLDNPLLTVGFGKKAKAFVEKQLEDPFEVTTAFASALGRSTKPRVYGFVKTSEGKDLAELLVASGLARSHGVSRALPDGTSADEVEARLDDIEDQAAMTRLGLWAKTDTRKLIEGRELNRADERADEELKRRLTPKVEPMDVNSAGVETLKLLPGIGEKTALAIIGNRPFKSLADLDEVPGIGPKTLEAIKPFVRFTDED